MVRSPGNNDVPVTNEVRKVSIRTETTRWLPVLGLRRPLARVDIARLIHNGQYDELIWLLEARRRAGMDDPEQLAAFEVIAQLCRTCIQLREQQHEHQRSLRQAAHLEEITRRRIELLLEPILRAGETDEWLSPQSPSTSLLTPERLAQFQRMASRLAASRRTRPAGEVPPVGMEPLALPEATDLSVGGMGIGLLPETSAAIIEPSMAMEAAPLVAAPAVAADIRIYCLGQFRVYIGDRPVEEWTGYRSRCLLKYLLVQRRRPAHADQLLDVFWRGSPPESARRSLYQSIYLLRQALRLDDERPAIVQADGGYMLNPDLNVWVDSEVFLEQYRAGVKAAEQGGGERTVEAFSAAESLYEGDFMSDEPYEDWPVARREEVRDAYLDLLDRLSRHYAAARQDDLCIAYCHKLLDIDNCREDIHRRLMRLFAERGERSRALRQYQRCVEALRAELDVDPLPETTDLYVKILNNSF
jgi:DNA-binding SARP family transcriptional activator